MYLLIKYPGGIIVEGVLVAKGKDRLRVIIAGFPDTVELKREGTMWSTSHRELVEIEFLMSDESHVEMRPSFSAVKNP